MGSILPSKVKGPGFHQIIVEHDETIEYSNFLK